MINLGDMVARRSLPEYAGWSGRCWTAVTWMLSGSRQLQNEPEISKP